MGKSWIVVACLVLGACQKPVVSGCEDYIKSRLKAPSTYKRISVSEADDRMTDPQIESLTGKRHIDSLDLMLHSKTPPNRLTDVHTVLVTYQANNGFNAPLQDKAICAFEGKEGDLPDKLNVGIAVDGSEMEGDKRARIAAGITEDDGKLSPDPAYPCCMYP